MARRLLVVTTTAVDDGRVRERVRAHAGGEEVEVHVVAPASDLSPLQWLASDEDEARARAGERADELGEAIAPEADGLETTVGDSDPVQAIEDALRTFPADELVLVTHSEENAGWLEEGAAGEALARFRLPVTHLVLED